MKNKTNKQWLDTARKVLTIEAQAILAMSNRLNDDFCRALRMILNCRGRLIVSGMGKSGHIASKIAATIASTGTPAYFVHPAEAAHGDLGMITNADIFLALSNSGESTEIIALLPALKRKGVLIISMTGKASSTLAKESDIHLDVWVEREACPLGIVPTSSTTATLALGDALAVALLDEQDFKAEDFALSHPGGSLGRRLLVRVADIMHKGNELPLVSANAKLKDALLEMTRKGLGMTAIVSNDSELIGVFTDGDLRRTLDASLDLTSLNLMQLITQNPCTIEQTRLASEAARLMETKKINGLLVLDENKHLVGALNMHDLLRAGVI